MTVKLIDPKDLSRMPIGINGGWVTSYSSEDVSMMKCPPSHSYVCGGCGDTVGFEPNRNCEKVVRASGGFWSGLEPYYEPMCPTCQRIKKVRMDGFPTTIQKINNLIPRLLKLQK